MPKKAGKTGAKDDRRRGDSRVGDRRGDGDRHVRISAADAEILDELKARRDKLEKQRERCDIAREVKAQLLGAPAGPSRGAGPKFPKKMKSSSALGSAPC